MAKTGDHLWKKGQSGNPSGRRAGSRNHATRIASELLDGEAEGLTRKIIELALAGDVTCLRVCIERLVAPRKDSPIEVKLPKAKDAAALPKLVARILELVASGDITPDEGKALCSMVESHRKQIETVELEARITALEQREQQ